ncbi:hypothetical protein B0H11DRAFT_2266733 [Mycena galericulata]|nr:hypothetical protein B0H11DRAFT_2266733 [Mycena galericulata]
MRPDYEVLHSSSWWKDFHKSRARRRARSIHNPPRVEPNIIDLQPQRVVTFVPGRVEAIHSRCAVDGSLVRLPSMPFPGASASASAAPRVPTTATHGAAPSKVIARIKRERNIREQDPDAVLLARLAASRTSHKRGDEKKAAATDAKKKAESARKAKSTKSSHVKVGAREGSGRKQLGIHE